MSARSMLLAAFAFVVASTACQPPAQEEASGALSDEDVAAIEASSESFAEAFMASNWAGVAALYTEDAVLMPPNQPAVQGRANIEAWVGTFPRLTDFSLENVEIDGRGDLAFVRGTASWTMMPEGAPEPIQETAKYLEIRRRQPDGTWLIAVDIFNSDLPLLQQSSATEQ